MTRYLVVSSDCHAGLPNEEYREWLDPEYREQFDVTIAERARMKELAMQGFLNEAFAKEWQEANERRGCAAAGMPRAATRSSTRTALRVRSSFPTPTP